MGTLVEVFPFEPLLGRTGGSFFFFFSSHRNCYRPAQPWIGAKPIAPLTAICGLLFTLLASLPDPLPLTLTHALIFIGLVCFFVYLDMCLLDLIRRDSYGLVC